MNTIKAAGEKHLFISDLATLLVKTTPQHRRHGPYAHSSDESVMMSSIQLLKT
jgi:hypothetical protein